MALGKMKRPYGTAYSTEKRRLRRTVLDVDGRELGTAFCSAVWLLLTRAVCILVHLWGALLAILAVGITSS
jgi:hypothetical protein